MPISQPFVLEYKGYIVADLSDELLAQESDCKISVFMVDHKTGRSYFAFYDSYINSCAAPKLDEVFKTQAVQKIKEAINENAITRAEIYTFELRDGKFTAVQDPKWWHTISGDYPTTYLDD